MNRHSPAAKAIITPRVDAICVGGLSIVIAVFVIVYTRLTQAPVSQMLLAVELYMLTDVLINGPHFMASYRLLYKKPTNIRKHPLVTILMPIVAIAFLGYVIYRCFAYPETTASEPMPIIVALNWVAPVFLGWHYMGQSWGMTASFAFLSDLRMSKRERLQIRSGFHALFVYHIVLAYVSMGYFQYLFPANEFGYYMMRAVVIAFRVGVLASFFVGLWGFLQLSLREKKAIPLRVWLPWIATYCWYIMVDVNPSSLFLVQGFHALQYLMFPVRVELNEYPDPRHKWRHLLLYYVALVVLGLIGFHWSDLLGGVADSRLPIVTATFVVLNLHHYFIDAVIWKIRDPEVRQSLFGHLDRAEVT